MSDPKDVKQSDQGMKTSKTTMPEKGSRFGTGAKGTGHKGRSLPGKKGNAGSS